MLLYLTYSGVIREVNFWQVVLCASEDFPVEGAVFAFQPVLTARFWLLPYRQPI